MMCKKHLSDLSSDQGLCASCLREKLFSILAVQSCDHPPPMIFPRSVSPSHVTKSNDQNRFFHSTPQSGPVNAISNPIKKEKIRFSLFRWRKKAKSNRAATSSPLPWWLLDLFSGKEKKEESRSGRGRRKSSDRGRGMSPEKESNFSGDDECNAGGFNGYSPETPPAPVGRRGGRGRGLGSRDVAEFAFCISPLVWVRPKHGNMKSKSLPNEVAAVVPIKPQLITAASFCKNRSRKIADFGRYHRRH